MADKDIIQTIEREGLVIARVQLEAILTSEQVEAFGKVLLPLADVPGRRVVLSFLSVHQLTSMALGEIIRLHKRLAETGGGTVPGRH